MKAPVVLFCNNNQWAISTPLVGADRRADPRRQGDRLRDAGRPRRRRRRARGLRGDTRGRRARARRRGADVHRGRHVPRRAARDGGRPVALHRSRAGRGGARERVRRPVRALSPAARRPDRRAGGGDQAGGARADARAGSPRPRRSRRRIRGSSSSTRTPSRRRRRRTTSPSSGGSSAMAERLLVEAVNDALHTEMERDAAVLVMGEDVGKLGGRLPRDRGAAGAVRRTIAASTRRSRRRGSWARPSGLCMAGWRPGLRDAVRRLQLPGARPAHQPRRPLPLAHAREDVLPADDPHAVRRRCPRARAPRRLARDVLRAHARA